MKEILQPFVTCIYFAIEFLLDIINPTVCTYKIERDSQNYFVIYHLPTYLKFRGISYAHLLVSHAHVLALRAHVLALRAHVLALRAHVRNSRAHVICFACARNILRRDVTIW